MAPHPLADLGAGLSTRSPADNLSPPKYGPVGQAERAFTAASTFMSGLMAISATQFLGAPLKMVDPKFYEAYVAFTKQSFGVLITTMTQWWAPTVVRVSGDKSIPKQLFHKPDGNLECRFPKRLVMMANHQLYTDWLYLWWVAYTNNMHGYIYIILKESLKNIPVIGWGAQFYNFIFLKRKWEDDKDSFKQHLDHLNNPIDPMWLLIFPEGTNLAKSTKEKSAQWAKQRGMQDMKHQLLPRSKGLQFCLQNLAKSTEWLYDCTIGYEGIPTGQFGQDVFTLRSSMFEGRPPKSVNMHFRRFKIADIPINNDKAFDVWLRNRWREKDYFLEHFAQYNRFPEDDKWLIKQQQTGKKGPVPAKSIETQIKSNSLEEFLSIFAPLSSVMAVLFLFYGGGKPEDMLKMIGEAAQQQQQIALVRDDDSQSEPLKLKKAPASKIDAPDASKHRKTTSSVTPVQAQRNLMQQYLAAIRPIVASQIDLPDRALRASNASQDKLSQTLKQKPNPAAKRSSIPKKAATTVPEKTKEAARTPVSNSKRAASLAAAPVGKPSTISLKTKMPAAPAQRPLNERTFSTTSTVQPGDSISAVNGPSKVTPGQMKVGPAAAKSISRTSKTATSPAEPTTSKAANTAKNVTIDPAMLMRMKAGNKTAEQKSARVNPQVLAKMKAKNG